MDIRCSLPIINKMFEKRVLEVYRYCNIRSFPIDCDKIIQKLGYRIVTYQSIADGDRNKLIELMQVSNDAFIVRRERTMYINANVDRRRQRFSKCHEIGHIALPTNDEDEADTFASEILAPLPVVARYGYFDVDDICKRFDVSVAMANRVVMAAKGKTIVDTEGILDYFTKIEDEDWEHRNLGTFRRAIPNTYLSCKAPVRKPKVNVKVSSRTNKAILERNEFIRNNPQIEWNDMRLAKRDAESFLW